MSIFENDLLIRNGSRDGCVSNPFCTKGAGIPVRGFDLNDFCPWGRILIEEDFVWVFIKYGKFVVGIE